MKILHRLVRFLTRLSFPKNLLINGRPKLPTSAFQDDDRLFRSFDKQDLDEDESLKLETIKFPDMSCNWSRFSIAEDIKYRKNGSKDDRCYSFSVLVSRYKKMATPVHDPLSDDDYPNYAHAEVRVLNDGEDIFFEPQKKRKINSKSKKLEYRQNIVNHLVIEF